MSSSYVRGLFEGWMQDATKLWTVPFYPTVNVATRPQVDPATFPMWCTAAYDVISSGKMGYTWSCPVEEIGEIMLLYVGEPGIGPGTLLTAVESDLLILRQQVDPLNRFCIEDISTPEEGTSGDADGEYRLEVIVQYSSYN